MNVMNCLLFLQYMRLNCWGSESWIRCDTGFGFGGVGGTSHLPMLWKKKKIKKSFQIITLSNLIPQEHPDCKNIIDNRVRTIFHHMHIDKHFVYSLHGTTEKPDMTSPIQSTSICSTVFVPYYTILF